MNIGVIAKNLLSDRTCNKCKYSRFTYAGNMCHSFDRRKEKNKHDDFPLNYIRHHNDNTCKYWLNG